MARTVVTHEADDSTLEAPATKSIDRLRALSIVDIDVHIHETPGALAPYCEQPWRKKLEDLASDSRGGGKIPQFAPFSEPWLSWPHLLNRRTTVTSAREMRSDLDGLGIRVGVLFPDYLLQHSLFSGVDFPVALARAYNRWLAEEWLSEDRGLKGVVLAPSHDPAVAANEIRTYANHPHMVGVFLPSAGVEVLYGNRRYDPVYEAALEAGWPVFLHSVTAFSPAFPFNLQGFETAFSAHVVSHEFAAIANLLSMIETGVPVRYPELRIVFTEGGIGWVAWIMMKLDKEHAERRRELPFLREPPSHYIKRQMYFATQPIEEPEHLADVVTLLELCDGAERVMFASDWPHHDFDHPSKLLQLPVSEEVQRKIMSENAASLLKLELANGGA